MPRSAFETFNPDAYEGAAMRAFRVAYDGRPFHGFQRQPDVPTVEDAIFDALNELDITGGKPGNYAAAGRTDAGVSALAQTVAFACPDWLTPAAFNSTLPETVRAWASTDVSEDFHATHDASEREYVYHLYAPDASVSRARSVLDRLSGEHDFHNLTPDDDGTVRDLTATVERDGEFLVVTLRAGGFARQLVRRVVSLVAAVARGESSVERIDRVLAPELLDGPAGVAPAPVEPLVLTNVVYPGQSFAVDEDAAESARTVFQNRYRTAKSVASVAATIRDGL